jgi:(E)-4-hydroxy-3-methylbut-2-enyl-diphosphate synthase
MEKIERKKTMEVRIGKVRIGALNPIAVQSMTNTKTTNVKATVKQIHELEEAGCEIIRVSAPTIEAAKKLGKIKKEISIPLVADIHFDYRTAIEAIKQGVDKVRINPGNIGGKEKLRKVVKEAISAGIPVRVGVNSGSLEPELLKKHGFPSAEALAESALNNVKLVEEMGLKQIVISLKSSDALRTIHAYRIVSSKSDWPLHLGVTEAGTAWSGTIKSSVGIGTLLAEGIGDTIRVSLTENPVEEVKAGFEILKALNLRKKGRTIISCPTCGRTEIDLIGLAKKVEKATKDIKEPISIAVMGCVVNGPGEAREADIGVAGGKGQGVIFRKGKIVKTVKEKEILPALIEEIKKILEKKE